MIINKYYVDIEIAYAGKKSLDDQSAINLHLEIGQTGDLILEDCLAFYV